MAPLSLKAAAKQSGVAKTTLLRSIRNGRRSANKDALGSWSIDPAELFRAFPPKSADPEDPGTNGGSVVQNGPVADPPSIEAWTRLASLQAKVEALEALVQRLDRDKQDLQ